ncbi:MAG: phosphate acetyltransferase [Deferribacteres bacterium]|nr:phosphate acetyltransferase [candidate division KSB1 bacterium]MCB9511895.1 phosphate acetyltransferase [Deferribacteres bacterium]
MNLLDQIKQKAQLQNRRIVFPESPDARVLMAAERLQAKGLCRVILVGERDEIMAQAKAMSVQLDAVEMISIRKYADQFQDLYAQREHFKPKSRQELQAWLNNPLFYGAMLADQGIADGMVAGSMAQTAEVLRAAIKVIGVRPDMHLISSVFLMVAPQESRILTYADCAVVPNPSAQQLADIAIISAKTHQLLTGEIPRVALLSFSTKGSAQHADVSKVISAVEWIKTKAPELEVDGELQVDAALVAEIGKQKAPGSQVAGSANVLIFPDLDAGNIAYKLTQRLANYQAIGPILQGLKMPVNDLSRGCSVEDIVNVACITSILGG